MKLIGGPDSAEQARHSEQSWAFLSQVRRYDAAIVYLSQALTMWEHVENGGATNTGFTAHSLALAYQVLWAGARKHKQHFRQALDLVEKIFGPQKPPDRRGS